MSMHIPGTISGAPGEKLVIKPSDFNNYWRDNPPQVITESPAEKFYCEYCFGSTFDDSRGHCCACGHPRKETENPPIPSATLYGEPITDEEGFVYFLSDPAKSRWGSILNVWSNL